MRSSDWSSDVCSSDREVRFNATIFSAEAIKRALYRFSDRLVADIKLLDGEFVCSLEFSPNKSMDEIDQNILNLKKEVLDQDLREKIKLETEPIRNLILVHAFLKTGLS